jgi:hypothetical protein
VHGHRQKLRPERQSLKDRAGRFDLAGGKPMMGAMLARSTFMRFRCHGGTLQTGS